MRLSIILSLGAALGGVTALPRGLEKRAPTTGIFTFQQKVNHFPGKYGAEPENSTFTMRYMLNDTFYQPGGPVICLLGGETSVESREAYIQTGIVSILARATGGLGIILEHRYYGESYPTPDLATDNLRWLTTEQVLADIAYFAQRVTFPGKGGKNLRAPGTPWILYGGSLAGAETAYTVKTYPHIIYGGIASSGVVVARTTYPEWYYTIQKNGPQECIKRIEDNTDRIDKILFSGDETAIHKLKSVFGLEAVLDNRDFAIAIADPIGNPFTYPTNSWQELLWGPFGSNDFYSFCSNVTNPNPAKNISAVDHALTNYSNGEVWTGLGSWADYIKKQVIPLCTGDDLNGDFPCFGTQNKAYWANTSLDPTETRQYLWQTCTVLGQYSAGAPEGRRTLLSRVVQKDRTQQWCEWAFGDAVPSDGPDVEQWNKYGNYYIEADRLAFVDGGIDPWQYGCVHSPGVETNRTNTLLRPSYVIAKGGHHWDESGLPNIADEPGYIQRIHRYEIEFVKSWLADFPKWKKSLNSTA